MLNNAELERLREFDTDKLASSIAASCRIPGNPERAVWAASYVLMRSLEDHRISIDTIDLYFETADENQQFELFIRQALGQCWDNIRELKYKFTADEFKAVLLFYNGLDVRSWGAPTPDGIAKLAARLMDAKPGAKILDIGTGLAGFIRECYGIEPDASYVGLEINAEFAIVAEMRADILGGDIKIQTGNAFDSISLNGGFSAVFANYPLGLKARNLGSVGEEYVRRLADRFPGYDKLSSMDWVFNRKAYDCVDGPGRAICIMANGSTWNTIDKRVRRSFLEQGIVEMIISLPSHIYESTAIGTCMIVLSHGHGEVMMVDASEACEKGRRMNVITDAHISQILEACDHETAISRRVSYEEIKANDFNLSPGLYLGPQEEEVENGVELGSLVSITRGAQVSASVLDELASPTRTDTQYLMLANIQNGIIDEDLPYLTEIDERLERYLLKDDDLILSKIGTPFKVAVAEIMEGQRILANGNLYILTVTDRRIDPFYLKAYLESEKGIAALKKITVGTTIPSLGVEQLKRLIIPLPPLEEQHKIKEIADEYRSCVAEYRLLQRKMSKVLDRMAHVYDSGKEG